MEKSKVLEMLSVFSKYEKGHVKLYLLYSDKNIVLNEFVKPAKTKQEAKSIHDAYTHLMLEKEYGIYFTVQYLAKAFNIDSKGKSVDDFMKLVHQKVKEIERKMIV